MRVTCPICRDTLYYANRRIGCRCGYVWISYTGEINIATHSTFPIVIGGNPLEINKRKLLLYKEVLEQIR